MRSTALLPVLASGLASSLLAAAASAQWSADPSANDAIGDRPNEQVTPKIAPDGRGGTWIAWFDNASGNYDVYAQHLDEHGVELLAQGGVPVSTHAQSSSLVDWDMESDGEGGCVIVFTDVRAGGDLDVYANRLDADGQELWGASGVTLSSNADFEAAPQVCRTDTGRFVVVWSRSPSPGDGTIRMQSLDAAGNALFAADGLAIAGAPGEDLAFCDVVPAESGSYVVQWIRDVSTFSAPRHVRAQKFDASGAPVWPSFVAVYDAGPVPIAHRPILEPDGAGGAYVCWHRSLAGAFESLVQHLDASGNELFPHNGVAVATTAGRWELDPSLAVLASGELVVAFNLRNPAQSQWGVGVQKLSAAGARLWTDDGITLAPFDGVNESFERCVPMEDGAIVLWLEQPGATPQKRVRAQRVDTSGTPLWTPGGIEVSSNLSGKDDLVACVDASLAVRAAWSDERNGPNDVYAQAFDQDGVLGDPAPGDPTCVDAPPLATPCPCGNAGAKGRGCASSFNAAGALLGAHGHVASDDVVLDGSGMNPTGTCIFLKGDAENAGGAVFGDGVLCAGGTLIRLRVVALSAGAASFPDATETVTLSARGATPVGSGALGTYAVYYRNSAVAFCPPATFNASNGYRVIW